MDDDALHIFIIYAIGIAYGGYKPQLALICPYAYEVDKEAMIDKLRTEETEKIRLLERAVEDLLPLRADVEAYAIVIVSVAFESDRRLAIVAGTATGPDISLASKADRLVLILVRDGGHDGCVRRALGYSSAIRGCNCIIGLLIASTSSKHKAHYKCQRHREEVVCHTGDAINGVNYATKIGK